MRLHRDQAVAHFRQATSFQFPGEEARVASHFLLPSDVTADPNATSACLVCRYSDVSIYALAFFMAVELNTCRKISL